MHVPGRPYLLVVIAFLGLSLAGAIPVTLSVSELGNLRSSIAQINESLVVARKAGALAEQIVVALMDFGEVALELDASERSSVRPETDAQIATLLDSITTDKQAVEGWLDEKQHAKLVESSESLLHSWEEIRRKDGTPLTRDEKIFHFLQMADSSKIMREILVEAEALRKSSRSTDQKRLRSSGIHPVPADRLDWARPLARRIRDIQNIFFLQEGQAVEHRSRRG